MDQSRKTGFVVQVTFSAMLVWGSLGLLAIAILAAQNYLNTTLEIIVVWVGIILLGAVYNYSKFKGAIERSETRMADPAYRKSLRQFGIDA